MGIIASAVLVFCFGAVSAWGIPTDLPSRADRIAARGKMVESANPFPIFTFAGHEAAKPWRTINDVVMGGRSSSRFESTEGETALFTGFVSLENNGGFASARSPEEPHDLRGFDGISLRVRGDGKTYKLSLRTDRKFDGVSYQTRFETLPGEWAEVRLPFDRFQPTYHGRILPDENPLDPSRIQSLGILISEGQEGQFRLEIDWIGAYRDGN